MGKKAKKVTIKEAKKGGAGTMAQTAEEKRKQEQDELQKQQQDLDPEEVDDEETSQGDDDSAKDQEDEEKTPFIQKARDLAVKVLKILVKWVLRPLAIAIVVFASMISLIVNLGHNSDEQDDGDDSNSDDPGEDDIPEEEFVDDSDSDEDEAE